MFCPNCGENVPDGSKFCSSCGVNLGEFASVSGAMKANRETSALPASQVGQETAQAKSTLAKKKNGKRVMVGLVAVAVVMVVVVVLGIKALFSFFAGKVSANGYFSKGNAYAYFSDGSYELITDIKEGTSIEIASSRAEYASNYLLAFSPDGKYVYYYTKFDTSTVTGTLCKAEYGKLKEDPTKNDQYTEVIASNVCIGFEFLEDGTVLYTDDDSSLFFYNGEDVSRIAKDVYYYYTDGAGKVAYVTGDYETGYTLYGVSLDHPDSERTLASHLSYISTAEDFDNILYVKQEEDYSQTLYVVGFDKDSQRLGRNVDIISTLDERVYFTVKNGDTLKLYDYVEDDSRLTDYSYVRLREALEDEKQGIPVKTLYCYADGKLTEISDAVLNTVTFDGVIVFNTADLITEKVGMGEITSVYDVADLFQIDYGAQNYVVLTTGTETLRMSDSAASVWGEIFDEGYGYLHYSKGKEIYFGDSDGNLSSAPILGGEVGEFQYIADEAEILEVEGSRLYYLCNIYNRDGWTYGDLYVYDNGKETNLAKDILVDMIQSYEDGMLLAYTDYRDKRGYELTLLDPKGKPMLIGEDVTQFIRVDPSTILYISDNDLYCHTGKEKVRVKQDVEWVWSKNAMEVSRYLSYYKFSDERVNDSEEETTATEAASAENQSSMAEAETSGETVAEESAGPEDRLVYFIENSGRELFAAEYLESFDANMCRLARNGIYARLGRKFKDASIMEYFGQFDWYNPMIEPEQFSDSMLNDYQIANRDLIVAYEKQKGYNK